jgi:hypothetical protein
MAALFPIHYRTVPTIHPSALASLPADSIGNGLWLRQKLFLLLIKCLGVGDPLGVQGMEICSVSRGPPYGFEQLYR